jgi:hypothetical protein
MGTSANIRLEAAMTYFKDALHVCLAIEKIKNKIK